MKKFLVLALAVTLILAIVFPSVNSWRKKDLEFREAFWVVFTFSHDPGVQQRVDYILTRDGHALAKTEKLLEQIDLYVAHPEIWNGRSFEERFESNDGCTVDSPVGLWPRDMMSYMMSARCSQYSELGFRGWPLNRRTPALGGERLRILAGVEAAREQFARDRELARWKGYALDREWTFQPSNYK